MLRKHAEERREVWPKGWGPTRCLDEWTRQKEGKDEARWPNQSFETSFRNCLKHAYCLMTLVSLERNFITAEANLHLHFCHNKCKSLQPLKPEENIARNHPFESGLDHVRKRGREIKIDDPFFLPRRFDPSNIHSMLQNGSTYLHSLPRETGSTPLTLPIR